MKNLKRNLIDASGWLCLSAISSILIIIVMLIAYGFTMKAFWSWLCLEAVFDLIWFNLYKFSQRLEKVEGDLEEVIYDEENDEENEEPENN